MAERLGARKRTATVPQGLESTLSGTQPSTPIRIFDQQEALHTRARMNERNLQSQITPATKRRASESNWEKHKQTVCKSSVPKTGSQKASSTENVQYKNKQRKKYSQTRVLQAGQANMLNNSVKINQPMLTKEIAMDCEMVGIGDGTESMIARVSLVNRYGICLYDKYVKPRERVTDYRTAVSGIRPSDLQNGENFSVVQKEVADILKGKILVGHALMNDLRVLFLSHPKSKLRDTSRYKRFHKMFNCGTPSLKRLSNVLLGKDIQTGEHSSVEDAIAAMQIYMLFRKEWEADIHHK